jgi:xyloglucan-specific exo-beta-1,4-glucanase
MSPADRSAWVRRATVVEFRLTNHGIEESVVNVLVSPPVGAPLLSGVKDFCGLVHASLDQSPPEGAYNPPCQETTGLDFAERDPKLVVRTGTVWGFSDEPEPNGLLSTDGGKTWHGFASVPPGAKTGGTVAITADGSSMVWSFKHDPVMLSRDPRVYGRVYLGPSGRGIVVGEPQAD